MRAHICAFLYFLMHTLMYIYTHVPFQKKSLDTKTFFPSRYNIWYRNINNIFWLRKTFFYVTIMYFVQLAIYDEKMIFQRKIGSWQRMI